MGATADQRFQFGGDLRSHPCRGSAICAMFEGAKHRGSSALTNDCERIQDVLKNIVIKHGRSKCRMELSSKKISNVRL